MFFFFFPSFGTLVKLVLLAAVVLFVIIVVKGLAQYHRDNQAPMLTEQAVVTYIPPVRDFHTTPYSSNRSGFFNSSSAAFVSFQLNSGEVKRFRLQKEEYERLQAGDRGMLTYQGSRFRGFSKS